MIDSLALKEISTFQNYISVDTFLINSLLTFIMSSLIGWMYVKFGNSLSNRFDLAKNFVIISLTTMLIITIVKSSLALSLGLVGALSIVRFRTAIKEPEELSYLFVAISIGLGFGANQRETTILGVLVISLIIFIIRLLKSKNDIYSNLHLESSITEQTDELLSKITNILSKKCLDVTLANFEVRDDNSSALFKVSFDNYRSLEQAIKELKKIDKNLNISFYDY